jgi:Holliday junction resolvase RusA-like endonuclease
MVVEYPMGEGYTLTLPYPPPLNHYLKHTRRGVFLSDEAKAYKAHVALLTNHLKPLSGALVVVIDIYRPARRGDIDASFKLALDALNGRAYDDDKQIIELHAYRFDDKHNPRLEVSVWQK